jgi:hypothetical protein
MKRAIFVTKSKLSQNLAELIVQHIPKKIEFHSYDSLLSMEALYFPKPIQLILMDAHSINIAGEREIKVLEKSSLKKAKRVLLHSRGQALDQEFLNKIDVKAMATKPCLADELMNLILKHVGYKI